MRGADQHEYRIKVTVRNNLLLSAIEAAGYKSQSEFAVACGLRPTDVNNLVGMRRCPIGSMGEFSSTAKVIMETLGAAPNDLWTDEQLLMSLKRNSGESTVSEQGIQSLLEQNITSMTLPSPEDAAEQGDIRRIVLSIVSSLTPREQQVIKCLYYGDKTIDETGAIFGVSCQRVRQIKANALRKLRLERPEYIAELKASWDASA